MENHSVFVFEQMFKIQRYQ